MALDGPKVVTFCILGFTALFLITGLGLIIFGSTLTTPFGEYFSLRKDAFDTQVGLRVGLILLILAISAVTILGAFKQNNRVLTILAVLFFVIFVTEISLGANSLTLRNEGISKSSTSASGLQLLSIYGEHPGVTEMIDNTQMGSMCCGVTDYRDWFTSGWAARQGVSNRVPSSCCKVPVPTCGWDMDVKNPVDVINIIGCSGLNYAQNDRLRVIGGGGLGLAFVHLLSVLSLIIFCFCFNTVGGLSPIDALKGKESEVQSGGGDSEGPLKSGPLGPGSSPKKKRKPKAVQEPFEDDDDLQENYSKDLLDKSK
ncbi:predicted protein [Nematostella vectensis]|uniref:Uncharacterized protein n=1 Tax=Nematostella vectensis TaxID=45351 RepID=A7SAH7_NEMVE|nr:predicted protein [Nematostella vectensis]|eukprot:XP_001631343.1 predicted protein [Nematostella vectensis]